ncbi:HAD-IA family hydrolase [Bacteroides sp. 519]|uniref:HAD-IA family hydrolase n=1 Tax=Bacteroides sp. 519 TaxID=2302937 RepID=UPI0013D8CDF5|nr:HAD-IA family hydrolase [Bacteroides sp. 519]NDV56957.1 HAD family hydrolase [Bacteroides sp. 519]
MKYSTVLFDFDYTLADSSRGIVKCFQNVLQNHNFLNITDDSIKRTIGKTLDESFSILTGITNPEELINLRNEYGKEASLYMSDNTYLFPESKFTLNELKNDSIRIGIISTKYRFRIIEFLDLHFPSDLFDIIVGGEDVTLHKPHPEGLNFALDKLQSSQNETLYVGDSTIDAETAMRAGVDFVGVTSGATTREELMTFPHKAIVSNLGEEFLKAIR